MPQYVAVGGAGPKLLAVAWFLSALAVISTVLRYFFASRIGGQWRWDFVWAVLATIIIIPALATYNIAVYNGVGQDIWHVRYADIFNAIYWALVTTYIGLFAVTFAKYSVIALLMQIEGPLARKRRMTLILIGALFTILNFAIIPIAITQCVPHEKVWLRYLPGSCPRAKYLSGIGQVQGYTSSATDLILALWPISVVRRIKQRLSVKIKICALMGVGTLPAIFSAIRSTTIPATLSGANITRNYGNYLMYCGCELLLIIILSSIPVLRPLYDRVLNGSRPETHFTSENVSRPPFDPHSSLFLTQREPEESPDTGARNKSHSAAERPEHFVAIKVEDTREKDDMVKPADPRFVETS